MNECELQLAGGAAQAGARWTIHAVVLPPIPDFPMTSSLYAQNP